MGALEVEIRAARRIVEKSREDRRRREEVLLAARDVRRASRRLRAISLASRNRALNFRWDFWSAGYLPEAPGYVPLAWEREARSDDEIFAATRLECERCAAAVRRAASGRWGRGLRRLPAVAALCSVAADRIREDGAAPEIVLSACARMLEDAERELALEQTRGEPEMVALAASCRAAARQARVALARLYASETA